MEYFEFQEILLILIVLSAIAVIPQIFYLLTLQNALKTVSRQNRRMEPGKVWLLFIPIFNMVWIFIVVEAIAASLKKEYEQMGINTGEKPTYNIGLAMAIMGACSIVPFLGIITGLGCFVCWIVYWVKVNETKNELLRLQSCNQNRMTY